MAVVRQVAREIKSFQPDVVFHSAWHGGNSYQYQNDTSQIYSNLYGSFDLLQIAKEAGAQRWIGLGTVAEYGKYETVLTEDLRPVPNTLYGISKYSACMTTQKLCELNGIDFVWLRPFWTYGPYDDALRLLPSLMIALLREERPSLTLGEQLWDYLYVEDAVDAICRAGTMSSAHGIFNLGSGEAHSIRSIVERVRDLINPNLSIGFGEMPYRADQIMHLQADISRLQMATGWVPQVSLEEGLKRTVNWYKSNYERVTGRY